MRAHVMVGTKITNTILVDSIDFMPGLVDASIGGGPGDDIISGVLVPKPGPTPESIGSIRARVWEAIKVERSRRESGGVLVSGHWFHSDTESRIKILGLVILGSNIPAETQWKTMEKDGSGAPIFVTMTRDLANMIFLAVADLDKLSYAKAEQHRIAMEAAANPEAYNFSTGWPVIFTG